jgi:hypothetical protein
LDAQINAIDELREIANRINDLRHERIDKIDRNIAAFKTEVCQMVRAVEPKLADQDPQDAVLELERGLALAKTARDLATAADRKLSDARQKAEQYSETRREARQNIESLQCAASVGSIDELRAAIGRSDRLSSLRRDLDSANKTLAEDGDGMAVDDLVAECAEVDLDDVAAREQRVGEELKGLRERLMKAREVQANARREFEAIGGSDRAARAAADRQAAFSEMTDVAEDYVSVRSAVLLLHISGRLNATAVKNRLRSSSGPANCSQFSREHRLWTYSLSLTSTTKCISRASAETGERCAFPA